MRVQSQEYTLSGYTVYIEPNADQYSAMPVSWSVCDEHGIQGEGLAVSTDSAELQAEQAINKLLQEG